MKSKTININNLLEKCVNPSEANKVMIAAIMVNQYDEEPERSRDEE